MKRIFLEIAAAAICAAPLSARPPKTVALMPAHAEIIFALGAGGSLVGVSSFCDYPPQVSRVEKVGDYLNPNIEKIYSLKPDIVLVSRWKNSLFLKRLRGAGLNVVELPNEKRIEDIYSTIMKIASLLGKEESGGKLVSAMKKKIPRLSGKNAVRRVYAEIDYKYWTFGNDSFLNDVLRLAGGKNIFSSENLDYFQASWESIVRADPEVVILFRGNRKEFLSRPMAETLSAAKAGKIIDDIDIDVLSRPSPRIAEAVAVLERRINGEEN